MQLGCLDEIAGHLFVLDTSLEKLFRGVTERGVTYVMQECGEPDVASLGTSLILLE